MNWLKFKLKKFIPDNCIIFYHKMQAVVAAIYFRFPAKKLITVGVTGTNGKTTTANMIAAILETAGFKVGMATTINFKIGKKEWENVYKMTTIPPWKLQKLLAKMVGAGCQYAVLETTSHAIVQNRIWGIPYDAAIFTNLTHEHLDYHKSLENYRQAKGKLFDSLKKSFKKPGVKKIAIINKDDPLWEFFAKFKADKTYLYRIGREPKNSSEILARKISQDARGSRFEAVTPDGAQMINLNLLGRFNIHNALAAISYGISQNIDILRIKSALEKIQGIPGRLQKIDERQDFVVIVDYAHTPDALQKIYETVKPLTRGKIIAVFGATGDRDKSKRPIMGAIAGRNADLIFVTNEDPYTEDPLEIINQVAVGIPRGRKDKKLKLDSDYFKILDRKVVIEKALNMAKKDDLVLITGKGAEKAMVVGDKKIPWDDCEIVRGILRKRQNKNMRGK